MVSYKELKELWNDIKTDKIMVIIIRIGLGILVLFTLLGGIQTYTGWPDKRPSRFFWGLYERTATDTVRIVQHDTVTRTVIQYVPKKDNFGGIKQKGETNVASENQQGGQTAGTINNNK